jgi:hypothetical protein
MGCVVDPFVRNTRSLWCMLVGCFPYAVTDDDQALNPPAPTPHPTHTRRSCATFQASASWWDLPSSLCLLAPNTRLAFASDFTSFRLLACLTACFACCSCSSGICNNRCGLVLFLRFLFLGFGFGFGFSLGLISTDIVCL